MNRQRLSKRRRTNRRAEADAKGIQESEHAEELGAPGLDPTTRAALDAARNLSKKLSDTKLDKLKALKDERIALRQAAEARRDARAKAADELAEAKLLAKTEMAISKAQAQEALEREALAKRAGRKERRNPGAKQPRDKARKPASSQSAKPETKPTHRVVVDDDRAKGGWNGTLQRQDPFWGKIFGHYKGDARFADPIIKAKPVRVSAALAFAAKFDRPEGDREEMGPGFVSSVIRAAVTPRDDFGNLITPTSANLRFVAVLLKELSGLKLRKFRGATHKVMRACNTHIYPQATFSLHKMRIETLTNLDEFNFRMMHGFYTRCQAEYKRAMNIIATIGKDSRARATRQYETCGEAIRAYDAVVSGEAERSKRKRRGKISETLATAAANVMESLGARRPAPFRFEPRDTNPPSHEAIKATVSHSTEDEPPVERPKRDTKRAAQPMKIKGTFDASKKVWGTQVFLSGKMTMSEAATRMQLPKRQLESLVEYTHYGADETRHRFRMGRPETPRDYDPWTADSDDDEEARTSSEASDAKFYVVEKNPGPRPRHRRPRDEGEDEHAAPPEAARRGRRGRGGGGREGRMAAVAMDMAAAGAPVADIIDAVAAPVIAPPRAAPPAAPAAPPPPPAPKPFDDGVPDSHASTLEGREMNFFTTNNIDQTVPRQISEHAYYHQPECVAARAVRRRGISVTYPGPRRPSFVFRRLAFWGTATVVAPLAVAGVCYVKRWALLTFGLKMLQHSMTPVCLLLAASKPGLITYTAKLSAILLTPIINGSYQELKAATRDFRSTISDNGEWWRTGVERGGRFKGMRAGLKRVPWFFEKYFKVHAPIRSVVQEHEGTTVDARQEMNADFCEYRVSITPIDLDRTNVDHALRPGGVGHDDWEIMRKCFKQDVRPRRNATAIRSLPSFATVEVKKLIYSPIGETIDIVNFRPGIVDMRSITESTPPLLSITKDSQGSLSASKYVAETLKNWQALRSTLVSHNLGEAQCVISAEMSMMVMRATIQRDIGQVPELHNHLNWCAGPSASS